MFAWGVLLVACGWPPMPSAAARAFALLSTFITATRTTSVGRQTRSRRWSHLLDVCGLRLYTLSSPEGETPVAAFPSAPAPTFAPTARFCGSSEPATFCVRRLSCSCPPPLSPLLPLLSWDSAAAFLPLVLATVLLVTPVCIVTAAWLRSDAAVCIAAFESCRARSWALRSYLRVLRSASLTRLLSTSTSGCVKQQSSAPNNRSTHS
mmetsp:Transcript_5477/g.8977  ORF Transcript_5477/g.8977 Transcript_5477/m.8977 type:complete len:207 (+) Transcript_5477:1838-2458(+)